MSVNRPIFHFDYDTGRLQVSNGLGLQLPFVQMESSQHFVRQPVAPEGERQRIPDAVRSPAQASSVLDTVVRFSFDDRMTLAARHESTGNLQRIFAR